MQTKEPDQSKEPGRRWPEPEPVAWSVMILCVLAVGLVAGFGAVVFRALIGVFHNLLFLGRFSFDLRCECSHRSFSLGCVGHCVPVLGAVGVAYLVKTFAPEAKGHGVPEVMDAIYYHDGKIRSSWRPSSRWPRPSRSAAGVLSAARADHPDRRRFRFDARANDRDAAAAARLLIAAGAGGGIAATFNTPIGGVTFAAELMLPCLNPPEPARAWQSR